MAILSQKREEEGNRETEGMVREVKVKSSPRHYALGSHEGLYGQCLNLVSVVRSNLECSYTDSPGQDTSPSQVPSKQCLYSFAAE